MIKNKKLILEIIVAVLMVALLTGALVYYNAIDKLPPSDLEQGEDSGSTDNGGDNGGGSNPGFVLPGNQPGNRCPTYDLRNVFGGGTTNTESLKGKVVVINFWYTTCGPCVAELPYFNQIANTYSDDVAVVIVHAAFDEDTTGGYINENYPGTKMIAVFDEKVPNQSDYYYKKLGGKGTYPMTVILDKDGIVTHNIKTSIHSYDELDGYVQTALSK
jgi:thiol-disulfide isomerase/thioredoxin